MHKIYTLSLSILIFISWEVLNNFVKGSTEQIEEGSQPIRIHKCGRWVKDKPGWVTHVPRWGSIHIINFGIGDNMCTDLELLQDFLDCPCHNPKPKPVQETELKKKANRDVKLESRQLNERELYNLVNSNPSQIAKNQELQNLLIGDLVAGKYGISNENLFKAIPNLETRSLSNYKAALLLINNKGHYNIKRKRWPPKLIEKLSNLTFKSDPELHLLRAQLLDLTIMYDLEILHRKGLEDLLEKRAMEHYVLAEQTSCGHASLGQYKYYLSMGNTKLKQQGFTADKLLACITKASEQGLVAADILMAVLFLNDPHDEFKLPTPKDVHRALEYFARATLLKGLLLSDHRLLNVFLDVKDEDRNYTIETCCSLEEKIEELNKTETSNKEAIVGNLNELKQLLSSFKRLGFLVTNLEPKNEDLKKTGTNITSFQSFTFRGKAYSCLLAENVNAAQKLKQLLEEMKNYQKLKPLIDAVHKVMEEQVIWRNKALYEKLLPIKKYEEDS